MLTNVQLWLGVITLARELVKYLREKNTCPIEAGKKAKEAAKAVKDKDKDSLKALFDELFD